MGNLQINRGQARAAIYLAKVNRQIIDHAARRRQRHDSDPRAAGGARLPAALGQAPVALCSLAEAAPSGKSERITPLGYKTAVRAVPRVLSGLSDADPRRRAANMLADAAERIGSVKGGNLAGSDTKAGVSDGGVTTKLKHAARLSLIEAAANDWPRSRHGRITRGPERVLLPIQRKGGQRQEIKAYPALVAVCLDNISLDGLLRLNGWAVVSRTRNQLADAVLIALDDVADALGLGRVNPKAS